nr:hypothetical protein [uncultured Dongia sp.]
MKHFNPSKYMAATMAGALLLGAGLWAAPASADDGFDPAHVLQASVIQANAIDHMTPVQNLVSEQEAQLWVLNSGYNQVSGLTRDGRLYRGTALLNGDIYDVVVDAQGNVLGAKE